MSSLLGEVLRINLYLQPIQFLLSVTGNLLNIRVLSSRTLRPSPCTYYLIAYAVYNILYTSLVSPSQFLRSFRIDWATDAVTCKVYYFLAFVFPVEAKMMLLLAAFDRYCSSSKSRQLHSTSNVRTAKISMLVGSISTAVYMSPMALVYYWNEINGVCEQYLSTLSNVYVFSQIVTLYVIVPCSLIGFGLATASNIRQRLNRIGVRGITLRHGRTERQFCRVLFLQVTVHLVFVLPFGVIYAINAFYPSTRTANVLGIRYIFVLWQQCDYFASFFLYVFSASLYRHELFRILHLNKCVSARPV